MFRFSIRDVLWLTVVVALGVAWWSDNKRIEKAVGRLEADQILFQQVQVRFQQEKEDELAVLRDYEAKQKKLWSQSMRHPPMFSHNPANLTAAQKKVVDKIFGVEPPNSP